MDASRTVVVIGGGPAGTFAAIAAKKQDPTAAVVLINDEHCEPYEKPPLSKTVLLGKVLPGDARLAGPGGVAGHDVALETLARCIAIDRTDRTVVLQDGRRLHFDALVIATGSSAREIPQLPRGMPRVHYLRSEADARQLQTELSSARDMLVVGGGLIGLEVAASAAELGVKTIVLEVAPRILARVCDEETGEIVHAAHRAHSVDIRTGTALRETMVQPDGRIAAITSDGGQVSADLVVVGTGSRPNDGLAAAAGLAIDDGIVVDEECRTSDPAIFAAGDVVRFPGPHGLIRLENWRHAQDQGTVAGRNAAGAHEAYAPVPSFWSEQYDLYIQGVGWGAPGTARVRRPTEPNRALFFDISDGRIVYAMGINAQRDLATVRRLIERRVVVDPTALGDPAQPLAAMLKPR
jgi:3-phenylpropionate/trans-cinnamate dioxygenase ferredoxin reductase component